MAFISAWKIIRRTFGFALKNAGPILAAIWMHILGAAAVLFLSLYVYFHLLAEFLQAASMRRASLALAALVAGGFVWLLLYALAAARLACLAMGQDTPPCRQPATRLYAASLRFILLFDMLALPVVAVMAMALKSGTGEIAIILAVLVLLLGSGWLTARMGMLLPAISVMERGRVLRRGFALTANRQGPMLLVWLGLVLVPAFVVQGIGELVCAGVSHPYLRWNGAGPVLSLGPLDALMPFLPELVITFSITSAICLVLSSTGSVFAYDALVRPR